MTANTKKAVADNANNKASNMQNDQDQQGQTDQQKADLKNDKGQRFFGRRKGQALSQRKQGLIENLLPQVTIAPKEGEMIDLAQYFPEGVEQVWLEIGFGKGEHLAALAREYPQYGFIGCEPFINGVAGLLTKIEEEGLKNIRIYTDDARHILKALPKASLARVFLLHPDPWPKKRHAQRRFVGQDNLDIIARVLQKGGEFRVGTDHPLYREWTAVQMSARSDFLWQVNGYSDWMTRPADWPATRYEAKAIEGYPTYFRYARV